MLCVEECKLRCLPLLEDQDISGAIFLNIDSVLEYQYVQCTIGSPIALKEPFCWGGAEIFVLDQNVWRPLYWSYVHKTVCVRKVVF